MHARLTSSSSSMDWRRLLFLACWRTQTKAAYLLPQHSHLQMHFFSEIVFFSSVSSFFFNPSHPTILLSGPLPPGPSADHEGGVRC